VPTVHGKAVDHHAPPSSREAAESVAVLLGKANASFKPTHIVSHFAYVGGGFGGRDHTPFPLYVALASVFFPGRPVRLAHDRYQQFQGGIKRHAFKMRTRIGVERAPERSRPSSPTMCSTAAASPIIHRT
jgi:CO/xanthine dehydrogenase Mo-binding subunit